jgi:hypothetical protein
MQSLRVERRPESIFRVARTELEDILSLINKNHRIFECSILLIGVSLFFCQVRELLICWLFFSVPFVLLALLLLGEWSHTTRDNILSIGRGQGYESRRVRSQCAEARRVLRCSKA